MPVRLSPVITAEAQPARYLRKGAGGAALVLSGGAGGAQHVVQSGPHIDGSVVYDWSFIMNSRAEGGSCSRAQQRRDGMALPVHLPQV